jgi:hypothetical protein
MMEYHMIFGGRKLRDWNFLVLMLSVLLTTGCKLLVEPSVGGAARSASGNHDCAEGNQCVINIDAANFSETFTAVPRAGFRFLKWKSGDGYVCAGTLSQACQVSNVAFDGNSAIEAIIASDYEMRLAPLFEPVLHSGFVVRDGNGNLVGEAVDVEQSHAIVRMTYTDDEGVEHGYGLWFERDVIINKTYLAPRWDNSNCSGQNVFLSARVFQEGLLKGMSPLFTSEYAVVAISSERFGLAKMPEESDLQTLQVYALYDGECVLESEPYEYAPTTIVQEGITDGFNPPYGVHRQ